MVPKQARASFVLLGGPHKRPRPSHSLPHLDLVLFSRRNASAEENDHSALPNQGNGGEITMRRCIRWQSLLRDGYWNSARSLGLEWHSSIWRCIRWSDSWEREDDFFITTRDEPGLNGYSPESAAATGSLLEDMIWLMISNKYERPWNFSRTRCLRRESFLP